MMHVFKSLRKKYAKKHADLNQDQETNATSEPHYPSTFLVSTLEEKDYSPVYNALIAKGKIAAPTGIFSVLPAETLRIILDLLEPKELGILAQTSSFFFWQIMHQTTSVWSQLEQQDEENDIKLKPKARKRSYGESEPVESPVNVSLQLESATLGSMEGWKVFCARQLRRSIMYHARQVEGSLREELEAKFHPGVPRMAAVVSTRYFPIPAGFYNSRTETSTSFVESVVELLNGDRVFMNEQPNEETMDVWRESDAWSSWFPKAIVLGLLLPVTTTKQLQEILSKEGNPQKKISADDLLSSLARVVGENTLVVFQDSIFRSVGVGGLRFLALGKQKGCVFQWETYSNFCGGPYSAMSCGMG